MGEAVTDDRQAGPGPAEAFNPRQVLSDALRDPEERRRIGLATDDDAPVPVIVELNTAYERGLAEGERDLDRLLHELFGSTVESPFPIAGALYRCVLSANQAARLANEDWAAGPGRRLIYRIWPDFPAGPLTQASMATIKADAAQRTFEASGRNIVWAVIDSGINGNHAHFREWENLTGSVSALHRDFTTDKPDAGQDGALRDGFGHGTHVAGIIAGGIPASRYDEFRVRVMQRVKDPASGRIRLEEASRDSVGEIRGAAQHCKLVSLKILDDAGKGQSSTIIRALRYVSEVNAAGHGMVIHGVNLSVGYEFDARWFACGQSPMCSEVDQLVRSGVVVVAAAGNTGYGRLTSTVRGTSAGLPLTINDPGNAEFAITVGATHRSEPYRYGISYFSSKGPTGDGRLKPDLVAPGEKITSCAAGQNLGEFVKAGDTDGYYVDDDGTSMAAPHVSGAVASFLSVKREFIGRPERVKEVFLNSATSLGRVPSFERRGLVDVLRAISSV